MSLGVIFGIRLEIIRIIWGYENRTKGGVGEKMRIIQVSPDWYPRVSGYALASRNFSKYLAENGHDSTILTCYQNDLDTQGLNVVTVPVLFNLLNMQPLTYKLSPTIKNLQETHDLIIIHSYMYEMNARIALLRKLGKINIPVVLFFRGGLDPNMKPHVGRSVRLFKSIYDRIWGKFCFEYSDHIITVSEPDGHLIKKTYNVASEKITYINNGTHVDKFYRKVHEKKRIIFIGRLVKWKGIEFFPKILDSIPEDIEFLVVGGGPLEDEIINLSKKYKNIKYFGDVPHSKIPELLSISDVLILPTFTEASPNVVIEASAVGIPSVAFSVGDVPNLLPRENGFAIKPYDINEFCNSINHLLNDDALREEMGRNARKFAERNLDYNVVAGRIMNVLESVYRKV
jgi:glycosyltransferase involved in cell wall biosynthesis